MLEILFLVFKSFHILCTTCSRHSMLDNIKTVYNVKGTHVWDASGLPKGACDP